MLKEEIRIHLSRHSELIALLAKIGGARGYTIWIGQREQRETVSGLIEQVRLRDLVTVKGKPIALKGVKNLQPVLDMDLLWLDGNEVIRAFEIESTITMTSGLQRGSNLPATVPKTMVIPEERENNYQRKMKSPLFCEHFEKNNRTLVYFNALREAFTKNKARTALEGLFGVKKNAPVQEKDEEANGSQRLMEFAGTEPTGLPEEALESAVVDE